MKKLALNIDDLRVDSFEPATPAASRGTVVGNGTNGGDTCAPSCPYTCGIVPQTADCRAFGRTLDCPVCA